MQHAKIIENNKGDKKQSYDIEYRPLNEFSDKKFIQEMWYICFLTVVQYFRIFVVGTVFIIEYIGTEKSDIHQQPAVKIYL